MGARTTYKPWSDAERKRLAEYVAKGLSSKEIAGHLGRPKASIDSQRGAMGIEPPGPGEVKGPDPKNVRRKSEEIVETGRLREELERTKSQLAREAAGRKQAESELGRMARASEIAGKTGRVTAKRIKRNRGRRNGTATAILMATDWHSEEHIDGELIGGINSFDLDEADRRIERLFQGFLVKLEVASRLAPIEDVVLWLGGDLINGYIHDELQESNFLGPTEAIHWVQDRVAGGIDVLLKETSKPIRVVCNYGNHGRSTVKRRVSTGYKTSWEWLAYGNLHRTYRNETRLDWNVAKGYFAIEPVQDRYVRFHHGDNIRFQGGVGGITVPVNKAIAKWNTETRADLDIFGHYHQWIADWSFIACGCLCGYNAYAQSIKAAYQPPTQGFALIERGRGLTMAVPVFVDELKEAAA